VHGRYQHVPGPGNRTCDLKKVRVEASPTISAVADAVLRLVKWQKRAWNIPMSTMLWTRYPAPKLHVLFANIHSCSQNSK